MSGKNVCRVGSERRGIKRGMGLDSLEYRRQVEGTSAPDRIIGEIQDGERGIHGMHEPPADDLAARFRYLIEAEVQVAQVAICLDALPYRAHPVTMFSKSDSVVGEGERLHTRIHFQGSHDILNE